MKKSHSNRFPIRTSPLAEMIRHNRKSPLSDYFRRLALASIAGAALSSAGCASSTGLDQTPLDGFEEPMCGNDWNATLGLDPAAEYDYMAFYHLGADHIEDRGESGTACSGASDGSSCAAELESLIAQGGGSYLVTTLGDTVAKHDTVAEVAAVLGEINTAQEAMLLVAQDGYWITCDNKAEGSAREVEDGFEVFATRYTEVCDPIVRVRYLLHVSRDGAITELAAEEISRSNACIGRRPDGLIATHAANAPSATAKYFAEAAHLEASAVIAFKRIVEELAMHGAPTELLDLAVAAKNDEVRHAEVMTRIAQRYGNTPPAVALEERPLRDLYAFALDNATEGCVRETFGALLGHFQSLTAKDREIAHEMATIAEDESRHATLSWKIAEWVTPLLSDAERATIAAAQVQAIRDLRAEMSAQPDPTLAQIAGLAAPELAVAWVDQLERDLWS